MRIKDLGAAGKPAVPSYDFSRVKILIAVPTRGNPSISFTESLAISCCALTVAKAQVSITYHQANNFVDMSRNKLLAYFLAGDFTHIWFIDDDMGWNADAILRMLAADRDFLAGIGPLKTDSGEDFACHLMDNPDGSPIIGPAPDYLMRAQFVGGAFLLLKRSMIERFRDSYPDLKSAAVDPTHGYSFFEPKYKPLWMTEDYVFCERWRDIGGQIWCFPDVSFTHQGTKDWSGNYFQYRVEHAKREQPDAALSEVQGHLARLAKPSDKEMNAGMMARASQQAAAWEVPEGIRALLCQSYVERVVKSIENIEKIAQRIEKTA